MKVTIEELKNNGKDFLTAAQIAPLLEWDPQYIRETARRAPDKLPFPVLTRPGSSRIQIPKKGFTDWWEREVSANK
ncbi:MAG: hypothetical protein MRZ52_09300 [Oscillospiraceae bacterium]|nr:hypothetical protein [Oscillospiraceae bacterium]